MGNCIFGSSPFESLSSNLLLANSHPCFNEEAHLKIGRIHLPVAPKCNIGCNFCDRRVTEYYHTSRPGLTSKILKPENAVEAVNSAIEMNPNIEVVGISGPGEPLFNEETFQTLCFISKELPELRLCVCTNGLLLPNKVALLSKLGVKTITITINAVDPKIGAQINSHCITGKSRLTGMSASELLIEKQLKGLEMAVDIGMIVKVNTVLIPSINLNHMKDVAYEIEKRGAFIFNIMPLIPLSKFKDLRTPTCEELITAREQCEPIIPIFRMCKQCRADACGVPGLE